MKGYEKIFSGEFTCATPRAFIEDSVPQKMQASNQARDFFAALASANARRRKFKEKKKMILPWR